MQSAITKSIGVMEIRPVRQLPGTCHYLFSIKLGPPYGMHRIVTRAAARGLLVEYA